MFFFFTSQYVDFITHDICNVRVKQRRAVFDNSSAVIQIIDAEITIFKRLAIHILVASVELQLF